KIQVKAQEIADKVMNMSDAEYKRFIKKLKAEINMLDAGIEETEGKISAIKSKPVKRMSEGDGNLLVLAGTAVSVIGSLVACANKLAPVDFVDTLIMVSSSIGSAGVGMLASALIATMIEDNPLNKTVKSIQTHIQEKKLSKLIDQRAEKNATLEEITQSL
ncbi:MAG: hypothetical protein ACI4PF_02055, partial [Christensenellales bacterium]